MKKALLLLLLLGCEPGETVPSKKGDWILVSETPNAGFVGSGIYKRHDGKEHVTYYGTQVQGGWSISVVKD